MKLAVRFIWSLLCSVLVLLAVMQAQQVSAAAGWEQVGQVISDGEINYPKMAFSSNGVPYVAYCDQTMVSCVLSVRRFNGSQWELVGAEHFSAATASLNILKLGSDNVPYVAYTDSSEGGALTVQRFNGTAWEVLGDAGLCGCAVDGHDMAISADGTPYVAYANSDDARKVTVMRFTGGAWEVVGTTSFSDGDAAGLGIALTSDSVPYIVYSSPAFSGGLGVRRFNGSSWEAVGTDGFTPGYALSYTGGFIMSSDDEPYVAFMDVANATKISVMRFDGSAWQQVGSAGFSVDLASNTTLAFTSGGTLYTAYRDGGTDDKTTVQRFNGTDWEVIGAVGFTPGYAYAPALAISNRDVPYVVYGDAANEGRLSVQRFSGGVDELPDPTTKTFANAASGKEVVINAPFGTVITCSSSTKEESLAKGDAQYQYLSSLVTYCFDTEYASNEVTLTFVTDLQPSQVTVRKYSSVSGTYADVAGATITSTTHNGQSALLVRYTIVDNGPLDENPVLGEVTDPVGLASAVLTAPNSGLALTNHLGYVASLIAGIGSAIAASRRKHL